MQKITYICGGKAETVSRHTEKMNKGMTQDERWMKNYEAVVGFIESYRRNPSRHRIEEHDMLNWVKANRKSLNAGKLKLERVEAFKRLLALMEENKHVNQWK